MSRDATSQSSIAGRKVVTIGGRQPRPRRMPLVVLQLPRSRARAYRWFTSPLMCAAVFVSNTEEVARLIRPQREAPAAGVTVRAAGAGIRSERRILPAICAFITAPL
jgi:hypothetical protein